MDCITCGLEAGYNRAVVDTLEEAEIGGFCLRCEKAEFGNSLERGYWTRDGRCALCDRDGFYALPKWEAGAEAEEDCVVCTVDYDLTDDTVRLCDEHYYAILNYEPESLDSDVPSNRRPGN